VQGLLAYQTASVAAAVDHEFGHMVRWWMEREPE
jgi:hypothetical protein